MTQRFVVVPKVPNAGLGNMLLVWARAIAFADLNRLPVQSPDWKTWHIGPWLRGEKCKRYYGNFFHNRNYQSRLRSRLNRLGQPKVIHPNPVIASLDLTQAEFQANGQHHFIFDQMPPWQDYFQGLKEHQPLVKQALLNDIHPRLLQTILDRPAPTIGIHIRLGDYAKPQGGEDFRVQRIVSTPIDWYVAVLSKIRQHAGFDVPAMIFSDGHTDELAAILALPKVSLSVETSALSDMLTLSRSQMIIATAHSSFSAWAVYLSQSPSVWYGDRAHLYEPILPIAMRDQIYEGGLNPDDLLPGLLVNNIDRLFGAAITSGVR
jgi:Glycosyl transferase family 11